MFSDEFISFAKNRADQTFAQTGAFGISIRTQIQNCPSEEQPLLNLLYGTLPYADIGSVPFETLREFCTHALFLRKNSPFCKDVPEDIFLHFVFFPRVNSEDIVAHRRFFFDKIESRISELPPVEAVLEVNRWCAEHMTYQSTNFRTEGPLTAYKSGLGRCGEESTFAVSAFRSVGIPARQIYVPYWAHCDDNHAWVEVYVDGDWHFLGACEPEPILDRGWFTDASGHAPLVHYRTFFDFAKSSSFNGEALIEHRGSCSLRNVTDHYTHSTPIHIRVCTEDGQPVSGVRLRFNVLNMAAFYPIANGITDADGSYRINLGRSSMHLELEAEGYYMERDFRVGEEPMTLEFVLTPLHYQESEIELDFYPPGPSTQNRTRLTAAQQKENGQVLARCAGLRKARTDGYLEPTDEKLPESWQEIVKLAGGNAGEIRRFYEAADRKELALQMLRCMAEKDYRDSTCEVLLSHLKAASYLDNGVDHFVEEVLNPRIWYEMIEDWRTPILSYFTEDQIRTFVEAPMKFMSYIKDRFTEGDGRYYQELTMQPSAVLTLGAADEKARKLLFVAGMRAFGVPARIDLANEAAEYYREGRYHNVSSVGILQEISGEIHLIPEPEQRYMYASNYTLARWNGVHYERMDYSLESGAKLEDPFRIPCIPGRYRLITTTRLPNGSQKCRIRNFTVKDRERVDVLLLLRTAAPDEMLSNRELDPFVLRDETGKELRSEEMTGTKLLIYADISKEPTEHTFNELIASGEEVMERMNQGLSITVVLHDPAELSDPTLQKMLQAVPGISVGYDDFKGTATMLARKMFLEPGVWPLMVLTDPTHRGYYGTCGYQVGSVELALSLAAIIE